MENSVITQLNYCYNCMYSMEPGQHVCPVCGHDNSVRHNTENALPEGTILAGKYLVGKKLGQGGFGITYLGFDLALTVRVAIKEYFPAGVGIRAVNSIRVAPVSSLPEQDGFQKGCQEFQTEARILAQFTSPNIVHVRDYFRENGTAYIVMDFVEGNSLSYEVSLCGGRMPWERVVELFKPLIVELENLHEEHLIHRDIKPDNIYLTKDKKGRQERLILLDFGSARRFVSEQITKTYSALVTPGYAPMEQYSQKSRQGPYTDVYSLSATMYTLITGQRPASATDVMMGIDTIQPISRLGIMIPAGIEKAILHGLEVKSENRPQTMGELYDELTAKTNQGQVQPGVRYYPETTHNFPISNLNNSGIEADNPYKHVYLPTKPLLQKNPIMPKLKKGDYIEFGKYQQSDVNNYSSEAIEWYVLSAENGKALVISRYALDTKSYNNDKYSNTTWQNCSLREWLNDVFFNIAFTNNEKNLILQVPINNPDNSVYKTKGGGQTIDRIFLLSIDEANKYFPSDEARRCISTAYTKEKGAFINNTYRGTVWWWLRSPGNMENYAAGICTTGAINTYGTFANDNDAAVRPALWLKL